MPSPKRRPDRFRDGILWGVLAALPLFLMMPYLIFITATICCAVAGLRGRSARPAIGAAVTLVVISGAAFLWLYIALRK